MLLIVSILILKLLSEVQGGCPVKCTCTENSITCIRKNLEYVPYFESLTNNPLIIDLSGNAISLIDIDDFSFDKSDQVKEIYLNSTGLTTIEATAFAELENLQGLYLSDNLLNSLPQDFITSNENMVLLDLSSNYFDEMPKIKSESLEVLAIAYSGISTVANDALDGLPNLRILLLQKNNIKSVSPVIFNQMSHLFFVRLAYNPWECNCKTIKLFNFLTSKKFVDLTEPVQCRTQEQIFVDVYDENGVIPIFKEECIDFELIETESQREDIKMFKNLEVSTASNQQFLTNEVDIDYVFHNNFYYSLILSSAIILSLIVGSVCGSCITFKLMTRTVKQTESKKELLYKFDDNVINYS